MAGESCRSGGSWVLFSTFCAAGMYWAGGFFRGFWKPKPRAQGLRLLYPLYGDVMVALFVNALRYVSRTGGPGLKTEVQCSHAWWGMARKSLVLYKA
jgi:hypothetical protein